MSAKTKIVVFRMKELIYTAIFIGLTVLLVVLLMFMFQRNNTTEEATPTAVYQAGVYTSSILFNDQVLDVEVVVDENHINSISLVNLEESVATMYPLVEPMMEEISGQIYETQSLENITYSSENQYTGMVLMNAIEAAVEKAKIQ